jgi:hypothetical protein
VPLPVRSPTKTPISSSPVAPGRGSIADEIPPTLPGSQGDERAGQDTAHPQAAPMPNELIGSREHNWSTSKVLSTAVRAHAIGSVSLQAGRRARIERVCAGQRGAVGAGGVEPPSSSVSANTGNRCAKSRSPRSAPTVDAEGKRSLDVQGNALFDPSSSAVAARITSTLHDLLSRSTSIQQPARDGGERGGQRAQQVTRYAHDPGYRVRRVHPGAPDQRRHQERAQ